MNFATITPTRGDDPELLEFCKHQLSRMTVKPEKSYFIDYQTESDKAACVKKGVDMARADGFDAVFIIEDNVAYPANFFERFDLEKYSFWGSDHTTYYALQINIKPSGAIWARWFCHDHPGKSSLINMGFKISALEGFNWPEPGELFLAPSGSRYRYLDTAIWEFAINRDLPRQLIPEPGTIGIVLPGIVPPSERKGQSLNELCSISRQKGIIFRPEHTDYRLQRLRSFTDSEQFYFYIGLMERQGIVRKSPFPYIRWWEVNYKIVVERIRQGKRPTEKQLEMEAVRDITDQLQKALHNSKDPDTREKLVKDAQNKLKLLKEDLTRGKKTTT